MTEPRLDWNTAEVAAGELTVEIDGDLPKGWSKAFQATAHLLGHGDWPEIKLKKGVVRVGDVRPGTEDRLRHLLESAAQQANADLSVEAPDPDDSSSDQDQRETDDDSGPDAEMTDAFRAFGEASG
jgi:hypothetical protein